MINLLPSQEKKNLQEEEKLKLTLILGILLLAILISFSLILFAIKIIISNQVEIQKTILEQGESEFQKSQLKEFQKIIDNSNQTISQLGFLYKGQIYFSSILSEISDTLPLGIYLTNVSLNAQTDKDGKELLICNLSGFSPDRNALLQFKDNLEKKTDFKEVSFPPSNWITPGNINFSVSFKISQ